MGTVSKKTRAEFEDILVSEFSLREIARFFDNHDIQWLEIRNDRLQLGERRKLVREYYSTIYWEHPVHLKKALGAFSDILCEIKKKVGTYMHPEGDPHKEKLEKLCESLRKDGFEFTGEEIIPNNAVVSTEPFKKSTDLLDKKHFNEHLERINKSLDEDPSLAIGSTKELIEAVLKTILTKLEVPFEKGDDMPKLLKSVQKNLVLVSEDVDEATKGGETVKILLSNLGQVIIKIDELRNLYGTGHGKEKKRSQLTNRHARLVVNAGLALGAFLLETLEEKK